ncbi:MAG: ATP-binding protein [Magnetospiraceae bacterium]
MKKPPTTSTTRNITANFLIFLALCVVIFSLFTLQTWLAVKRQHVNELKYVNRLLVQGTRLSLVAHEGTLRVIGNSLFQIGANDYPEAGRFLIERIGSNDPEMAGYGLARPDGQLVLVSGIPAGKPLPNLLQSPVGRAGFQRALSSKNLQLGQPYFMKGLTQWVIPIRVAIPDRQGEIAVVMTAGFKITGGTTVWSRIELPPSTRVMIVHTDGYVQYAHPLPRAAEIYDDVYAGKAPTTYANALKTWTAGRTEWMTFTAGERIPALRGSDRELVSFNKLPEYHLGIFVSVPSEAITAAWARAMLGPTALLVVILLAATWYYRMSKRHHNEQQAQVSHARRHLEDAIENLNEGFALWGPDDRLIMCNHRYRQFYENSKELLIPGVAFEALLRATVDRSTFRLDKPRDAYIAERLAYHNNPVGSLELQLASGMTYLATVRRTSDGGAVAVHTDITEVKRAQQQILLEKSEAERANKAKSDFLAHMSHELRTPLNSIIGYSDFILHTYGDGLRNVRWGEYIEIIHSSGKHLLELVSDLLDLSRIEAGVVTLEKSKIAAGHFVEEVAAIFLTEAAQKGVVLKVALPEQEFYFTGDPIRLKQVLFNLISNSLKFSTENDTIIVSAKEALSDRVEFSVEDTGSGIDSEHLETVFEPFTQARSDVRQAQEGAGLGLSIVRSIAELHGGEVKLVSAPGVGTTVTVFLPKC